MKNAPLIGNNEYKQRRKKLFSAMQGDSAAILFTYAHATRNHDAEYPYRASSDMVYLTNFREPESIAVLIKRGKQQQFILFCRPRNQEMEIWNGRRAGPEGAVRDFGANQAYTIDEIDQTLPKLLIGLKSVYYNIGENLHYDARISKWFHAIRSHSRSGIQAPESIHSLTAVLHEMRLIKSSAEIRTMKRAAKISAEAHCRAMQISAPGKMEYELEAEILHHFRKHNCAPAYNSIVGTGDNACILHYVENNAQIKDGDMILIDAGAEFDCYAGDITRSFPANGQFSEPQRQLYQLVLDAQYAALKKIKPGNTWNQPHDAAVRVLTRGLIKLGLLKGDLNKNIKDESYRKFYMHRTGHWLGMDVHDAGKYKLDNKWRKFKPGMALTVEPGLYVSPGRGIAKKWWNIGIRIEDDVIVTRSGHEVITSAVPKEIDAIEKLMAK